MSLQKEITIILLVMIGLLAGLSLAVQKFIIYPSYRQIDHDRATNNMAIFRADLDREIQHLNQLVLKWSARDDTYEFIQNGNPSYLKTNLSELYFASSNISSVYFIDNAGRVVWGKTFDPASWEPIKVDSLPDDVFPLSHPLLHSRRVGSSTSGIAITDHGPLLVAARPIVNSSRSGPIMGTVIIGRLLDEKLLDMLGEQSGVDARIWSCVCNDPQRQAPLPGTFLNCGFCNDGSVSEFDHRAYDEISPGKPVVVRYAGDNQLYSYAVYPDISGQGALLIRTETLMETTALGKRVLKGASLSILAGGLFIIIVLLVAIRSSVLKPIMMLTRHAVSLRSSETLDSHISDSLSSRNEIGILAREFDLMVHRLGQARRQLVEQSYYSGMAEVASGVRHGIRNALTPIISHIDLMREELKDIPLSEMKAAGEELASNKLSSERFAALKDFKFESQKYLENLVSDFRSRLNGMAERVSVIEKILTDQDKFASGGRPLEKIDLVKLVRDAQSLLHLEYYSDLDIIIDDSLAKIGLIEGHRNALLHIMTNLINNAAEAIFFSARRNGRIEISAEHELIEGRNFLHVIVKDNGCGILAENLQKIFERGYTTKGGETSGIGLHWCANTLASIRGRLYAESAGVNKGSSMHLLIPGKKANNE